MNERDTIFINNVALKFSNYILPSLPTHIERYLIANPHKIDYYIDCPFEVENIVRVICNNEELLSKKTKITTQDIMQVISKFVERDFKICS